jgi:hypothetical protein
MNHIAVNYGHFRLTDSGLNNDKNRFLLYNRRSGDVLKLNKQEYDYIRASKSAAMACIEIEHWHDGKKGKNFDVV